MLTKVIRNEMVKISAYMDTSTAQRWTIEVTRWNGPSGRRRKGRPLKEWSDEIMVTAGKDC